MELSSKAAKGEFFDLDEELFLGRMLKNGRDHHDDVKASRMAQSAKQALSKANERLVYSMAHKFYKQCPRGTTIEDCIAAGMLGMARALTDYDPDKGFKFSTYATRWIYHFIQRLAYKTAKVANLPGSRIYIINSVKREQADLEQAGVKVTPSVFDSILSKYGIDEAEYLKIKAFDNTASSLDTPIYDNNVAATMADIFTYDQSTMTTLGDEPEQPEDATIESSKMDTFRKALDKLNDTQRRLIDLIYLGDQPMGRNGEVARTPAAARRELGLSKSEADRELKRAMTIIRKELLNAGYEANDMI